MVCIYCGGSTQVINSRHQKRANAVWRRRSCSDCGATTTSIEQIDYDRALRVRRTTLLEPFSRDKLFLSVHSSLRHRTDALEAATALTSTIMSSLMQDCSEGILDRTQIRMTVHTILDRFDAAAAIHYTAFHKNA